MKKYMIGFFSVLFLITGCLIAGYQVSYNNLLKKEKAIELTKNEKNDSIQTRRSSAKGESVSDDAYYLKSCMDMLRSICKMGQPFTKQPAYP